MGRMLCYLGLHHTQRMLRKRGRRGLKPPRIRALSCPRQDGDKVAGHLQRPNSLRTPRDSPESPCPHPLGQLGGQSWCCTDNPWSGKGVGAVQGLWVQCRVCGSLIVPYKHQQGPGAWGDTCPAGAPSAGHGRVGNSRNTAEEELRLPGAAVHAPPGCFPPQQEVARSASSADVPVCPLPARRGHKVSPSRRCHRSERRQRGHILQRKPSASFRSDLHPGDAAAPGGAGAD